MSFSKYEEKEVRQAAVRVWPVLLGHVVAPPLTSLYYASKTSFWKPFWSASALWVVLFLVTPSNLRKINWVLPPSLSATLILLNSKKKKEELGIETVEEADKLIEDIKEKRNG